MLTQEQNDQLTRAGRGTLMGDLFRRYWIPALHGWEIAEPDCAPVRVQIMGEKLAAFRDSEGRIGVIDEFCAHRSVSLKATSFSPMICTRTGAQSGSAISQ